MPDRIALLVNPARSEIADRVVMLFDGELELLTPNDPADIAAAAQQAVADGVDVIAAVGGDGTQRTVAAAVVDTSTALAIIPGGTVNLLAKVLALEDLDAAVAALARGRRRLVDVGTCNGTIFVLNASSGYDASVIDRADQGLKRRWGRLGFVVAALAEMGRRHLSRVRVDVDGVTGYHGRATTVIVTNVAQRASADLLVAPDAAIDDGLLHVLVVRAATVRTLFRLITAIVRRKQVRPDDAIRLRGVSVTVDWSREVAAQIDGDPTRGHGRFEHRVRRGALTVSC